MCGPYGSSLVTYRDVVRNQGKWNGIEVAIKLLDKESVMTNSHIRLEVKAMRDLRHNNVASFIGACLDSPNVCILMETAPKVSVHVCMCACVWLYHLSLRPPTQQGSLDDILSAADALNLDWNFKFSMLKDICRGMNYLSTTPIKSHGRLKSSNCVIDNRYTQLACSYTTTGIA